MIVRKHKETGEVVFAEDLGASYYTEDWEEGTQEDILADSLKKLNNAKKKKLDELYNNYLNRPVTWSFIWQGQSYSFQINGLYNASVGLEQAYTRLKRNADISGFNTDGTFQNIDVKYRNDEYGFKSIYIAPFTEWKIDRIVFKGNNSEQINELDTMYQSHISDVSPVYNSTDLKEYQRYMIDYYPKEREIVNATDEGFVQNYDTSIKPITLTIEENLIDNVVFNQIL